MPPQLHCPNADTRRKWLSPTPRKAFYKTNTPVNPLDGHFRGCCCGRVHASRSSGRIAGVAATRQLLTPGRATLRRSCDGRLSLCTAGRTTDCKAASIAGGFAASWKTSCTARCTSENLYIDRKLSYKDKRKRKLHATKSKNECGFTRRNLYSLRR